MHKPWKGASFYKFVTSHWRDEFFARGALRLGTIRDYRDTAIHGEARGDEKEGRREVKRIIGPEPYKVGAACDPLVTETFGNAPITLMGGMTLVHAKESPDGFIFCTGALFNEETFRRWHREEGYDACYAITAPLQFISAVSEAIERDVGWVGDRSIDYAEDQIDWQHEHALTEPHFIKQLKYAWQVEHRMVWGPRSPFPRPLRPWNIEVPAAVEHCRPLARLVDGRVVYD